MAVSFMSISRSAAEIYIVAVPRSLALQPGRLSTPQWEYWGTPFAAKSALAPPNPAPAEAAFPTAIAVAQQQNARSFPLRAALSLAKLYQSTGRPIDAHDVLGPTAQGFSATREFPQIAEAKALFDALAVDERVRAKAARRAQRLKLQTTYGQAVMWSKGYAAEETKAVFARESSRQK